MTITEIENHSEYPPLRELFDELERIDIAEEKYARLGEV